jgi:hypothetical protein
MSRILKYGIAAGIGFVAGTVYGAVKQKAFDEQDQQNELEEQIPDEVLESLPPQVRHMVAEHPEEIELRTMGMGPQDLMGQNPFSIGYDEDDDDEDGGTDIDLQ